MDFIKRLLDNNLPVVIFDGAMGTSIQSKNLSSEDFGGESLEGCNEYLTLTRPELIKSIHREFLSAGCDVIETNTFGAASVVLCEYNLEDQAYLINKEAALIARSSAQEFSTAEKPRYVAGSIGPTTKLPTLGHIEFDALTESYQEQAEGLIAGMIDLFIVETCQDVLQIKSALQGIEKAQLKLNTTIPIMVSVTMETNGKMLVGTDIATVITILQPYKIDILGLNCATGPEQMKEHIKYLSDNSPFILSCIPNAGLPENIGGRAHYKLTPLELKMQLMHFILDLGVRVVGGCCGTTPNHINELYSLSTELLCEDKLERNLDKLILKSRSQLAASSIYNSTLYQQDKSFLIIGERLNASGSKKVRELLIKDDWDGLVSIARGQVKENAHILDVNVDYVGRNGEEDMANLVSRLVTNVNLPLMLDSTEWQKMEAGLKKTGGKCILNSTNYEDGDDRFIKVINLAKKYGAGIVIGTIDEEGMARTAEKKYEIAMRAYKHASKLGLLPEELFFDPLALPISTGIEEDRRNGIETLNSIKLIKKELKGANIILGVSNISFGLSPAARISLNSVFLHEAYKIGLDSAIVSPSKILPLVKIKKDHIKICHDLINDSRKFDNDVCIYDPLTVLTSAFDGVSTKQARDNKDAFDKLTLEDKLKQHIIEGEKIGLNKSLELALEKYQPLEIINNYLLSGMKVVGQLFGSGQMQLPFVLQSAETMKFAVSILEPFMDKSKQKHKKAKVLIATVKGDVHDIGKNLVDIILTNNGYEVINLGIKQDISAIIEAQAKYQADCIAMSGLLVKSTAFMKDNLLAFNDHNITVPVILGGAALTPSFVNKDCSYVYKGMLLYGKDAFTDLKFMEYFIEAKKNNNWSDYKGFTNNEPTDIKLGADFQSEQEKNNKLSLPVEASNTPPVSTTRSEYIQLEKPITPPFVGSKVINNGQVKIPDLLFYLDKKALFAGQWQMKRGRDQSVEDYKQFIKDKAEPILSYWLDKIINEDLLNPALVYGYFKCMNEGNKLIISNESKSKKYITLSFPRQKKGKRLCIADYFYHSVNGKPIDVIPMQAVTMGEKASDYANKLFQKDSYSDYLYFHGLAVQLAEALAEWTHCKIRRECGFSSLESNNTKDLLSQKYRGCRFSFGYPACPNVSDSAIQLELLEAERINLRIDESDQLHPEQSTTAIVALHSQASHFSA